MDLDVPVAPDRRVHRFRLRNTRLHPEPVLLLVLVVAGAFVLIGARHLWFFGDEWAFLIDRRRLWASGDRVAYLFAPHNEHLSTLPVVVNSVLFAAFGLRTYLPYLAVVVIAHLVLCYLLYRVALRCGVARWPAAATVVVFAFFGSGAENLSWAFQIGFVGATAIGVGQLIMADHDGALSRRDAAGAVLGCLGVLTAGVAVTMVAVVGLLLVLRRRWVAAAVQVIPAALLYGAWYVSYGSERMSRLPAEMSLITQYVQVGLATALDAWVQLPPAGTAVGLGLLLATAAGWLGPIEAIKPAVAMASGSVLLYAINGFGRASFGVDQARASRYVYIAGALLLPLIAVGLAALWRHRRITMSVAAALLAGWSLLGNASAYLTFVDQRLAVVDPPRDRIMAAALYAERGSVDRQQVVEPTYSAPLTMGELGDLLGSGDLSIERSGIAESALLQAAADFGVETNPMQSSGLGTVETATIRDAVYTSVSDGCLEISPSGPLPHVELGSRGAVSARIGTPGTVTIVVSEASQAATREVTLEPGVPTTLTFDVMDGVVGLDLMTTPELVLCGIVPP